MSDTQQDMLSSDTNDEQCFVNRFKAVSEASGKCLNLKRKRNAWARKQTVDLTSLATEREIAEEYRWFISNN